jgi:hypothetical protein
MDFFDQPVSVRALLILEVVASVRNLSYINITISLR